MAARRAKRENGGLGEDPPGSTITYQQVLRTWIFSQGSDGALPVAAERSEKPGVWGRIPQEAPPTNEFP
jgi:hypothetical protein